MFGLGLSGIAAAKALRRAARSPCAWDDGEKGLGGGARRRASRPSISREADWSEFAALVLAPGVPLTHPKPHWTVERASAAGVEVIGDTELFCRERRARRLPGQDHRHHRHQRQIDDDGAHRASRCRVGGPARGRWAAISARPCWRSIRFADDLTYVIEYSSYQIDLTPTPRRRRRLPAQHHARPSRPSRHHRALRRRQGAHLRPARRTGTAVVGVDDDISPRIARSRLPPGKVKRISVLGPRARSASSPRTARWSRSRAGRSCRPSASPASARCAATHNAQNAAAALALCRAIGLTREEIAAGLPAFPASPTAWRRSAGIGRVLFVNDSKATNADAAAKALASFDAIYWIAGGLAKGGRARRAGALFPENPPRPISSATRRPNSAASVGRRGSRTRSAARSMPPCRDAARDAAASSDARAGGAAVARLRLLRPIPQFRGARRCVPRRRRGAARHPHRRPEAP